MIKIDCKQLERNWKTKIQNLIAGGINDTYSLILLGQCLVESYNDRNIENKIYYIKLVSN